MTVDLSDCRPGARGRPTARFAPLERPIAGQRTVFRATSTDPDTLIVSNRWDLDNDGAFDDASGPVAARTWPRPGTRRVGLKSTDLDGRVAVNRKQIRIAARPSGRPSLSLRITTSSGGSNIVFLASGPLGTYRWDLDGDGAFDDGRGSELSRTYRRIGNYRVRVRLTDTFGRVATRGSSVAIG